MTAVCLTSILNECRSAMLLCTVQQEREHGGRCGLVQFRKGLTFKVRQALTFLQAP